MRYCWFDIHCCRSDKRLGQQVTNWRAMQVYGSAKSKKQPNEPSDTNLYQLTMASWHANLSKGSVMLPKSRGGGKPKGRGSRKEMKPPIGGWKGDQK